MLRVRVANIGVAVCAIAAILALSVLPAEHLHASNPGHAFVHAHAIDGATDHVDVSLDHDDHSSAKTLDPTFEPQQQHSPTCRALLSAAVVVAAPDAHPASRATRIDAEPAHGPPIRPRSLRAPPA